MASDQNSHHRATKKEHDAKKTAKDTEPSPTKTTKRKAESEDVDAAEDVDGTIVTVSTSSPLKKTKVTNESETMPQALKKTSESKPETSKITAAVAAAVADFAAAITTVAAVAATPKAGPSTTTNKPEPELKVQPKAAGPQRETKIEIRYAPSSSALVPQTPARPKQLAAAGGSSGAPRDRISGPASGPLSRPGNDIDRVVPHGRSEYPELDYDEDEDYQDEYDGAFDGYDGNDYDDPADYADPPDNGDDDADVDPELYEDHGEWDDDNYSNPFDGYSPVPYGLPSFVPLGLLNGRYTLSPPSESLTQEADTAQLSLVLMLRDSELWGKFDLGPFSGILYFAERPRRASGEPMLFKWRGRHRDGRVFRGDGNEGYIEFHGGGDIRVYIGHADEEVECDGVRPPGQTTWSGISSRDMMREWDGYN
ncbi:hypothetical protein F4820DRAFT_220731 [Hypoxylon rubiginosum]|uniref:Uncharacterized protein n=1 Tax=Hypoxylon rubiginosum TaxID=110542 RepID=A0ACB9ZG08_9PEZI|nr:hypothetical protein F4820DRAFT_220731 [Hypoxylon rubiginosum]